MLCEPTPTDLALIYEGSRAFFKADLIVTGACGSAYIYIVFLLYAVRVDRADFDRCVIYPSSGCIVTTLLILKLT
jgi:hypothetical protein